MDRNRSLPVLVFGLGALGFLAFTPASAENCHPAYIGACVPNIAGLDVDCAGGQGDGPLYLDQTVTSIADDPFGLDTNDPDNLACEPYRGHDPALAKEHMRQTRELLAIHENASV